MKIGSHVSCSGDKMFLGSVEEALKYEANCLMLYTGAPQATIRKPIEKMRIEEALALLEEKGISIDDVVVHAPYIVNLANPNEEKRRFAIDFLTNEARRCEAMKVTQMVLHPGNYLDGTIEQGIKFIASGVNEIISNTKSVKIALETMAGKGSEIGSRFEELKGIIDLIDDKSRISVCFDTCHTNDSGYDVKNNFDEVIDEFDRIIGINYISCFHINDSKNSNGSHKDRHANFGFGLIGFDALIKVIYDQRFLGIPKILETPYIGDFPPYYYEIKMIKEKRFNENLESDVMNGK